MDIDPIRPFDASLRLWSDAVALAVARLGLPVRHLHVRGQPMAASGPLAGRLARRHYASLADARCDAGELQVWLEDVIEKVRSDAPLVAGLRGGEIDGTIWVAVLGSVPTPAPEFDARGIAAVRALGLGLLVENYSDIEDATGLPRKTWIVTASS